LESLHLHEIAVVGLSEILFNNFKLKSMKELICKISIHMIISWFLKHLEGLMFFVGGQTIPFGRLVPALKRV
jgi:hypothetical protein